MDGWRQNTVSIDKAKLKCPVCTHPLKPPIFQCAAGHLACGACHGQLPDKDRCYECGQAGGYSRNIPLEDIVRSNKVLCPYFLYGCSTSMTYLDFETSGHHAKCPNAPCRCPESGCALVVSPTMLARHLNFTHSWPVYSIDYRKWYDVPLQESRPRVLLTAKEDGRVFMVSAPALRGISLVCLRANAAAGPHYMCTVYVKGSAAAATGKVQTMRVDMEVPSCAVVGGSGLGPAEEEAPLIVPRKMLNGPSQDRRLNVGVMIDKVQTQT